MSEKTELTAADLALYLGCECVYEPQPGGDTEHGTLVWVLANIDRVTIVTENHKNRVTAKALYFKPILRPLSDMTEMELLEFAKICSGANEFEIEKAVATNYKRVKCLFGEGWTRASETLMVSDNGETWYTSYFDVEEDGGRNIVNQHAQTIWLIRNHFDLFGWIPAGLALDKTKIQ